MLSKATIAALTVWAVSPLPAVAQQSPSEKSTSHLRAEVLVLGVYHMSNPGRDIVNMQADDVLAPKRQSEIAEVIAVLKKFHPTKVAVESGFDNDAVSRLYGDYLMGKHELTRNETQQIGFRLAKELGQKTVYAVDVDGEFPFPRVVDYAKARGRTKEFDALMGETGDRVKATNAYLASHTVLATLLYLNSDDQVAQNVGHYYQLAHFGEPWNWAGADLVSDWFRRNMRIYSNVMHLTASANERVLVIFGYGHIGWLQQIFASDPTVRLRKLAEFVK
jgi:hypothetical protein